MFADLSAWKRLKLALLNFLLDALLRLPLFNLIRYIACSIAVQCNETNGKKNVRPLISQNSTVAREWSRKLLAKYFCELI